MLGAVEGQAPALCELADTTPISDQDRCIIDPDDWEGGIGVWGALDPVYDTSQAPPDDQGVHVHARANPEGNKQIDHSFREVVVSLPGTGLFSEKSTIVLDEQIARAHTASMVFGMSMKFLRCNHCNKPHIDSGVFAVTPHRKHLCTYCGKEFFDSEAGIANPIVEIKRLFMSKMVNWRIALVERELNIVQADYPGGIRIWGSNPAIVWSAQREEEAGIHIHLYDEHGDEMQKDETFGKVTIDGLRLDDTQIRCLMVQKSLPHVADRVEAFNCPNCEEAHFDTRALGVHPHDEHVCTKCQHVFRTARKVVGNPMVEVLAQLAKNRAAQQK
jgi:transposase-like protein